MPSYDPKKLSQLSVSDSETDNDTLVMVRDNGDSSYSNYRVLKKDVAKSLRKVVTVTATGDYLVDDFILNGISCLAANNQIYIAGVDFVVMGDTISGLPFYEGQIVVLFI